MTLKKRWNYLKKPISSSDQVCLVKLKYHIDSTHKATSSTQTRDKEYNDKSVHAVSISEDKNIQTSEEETVPCV